MSDGRSLAHKLNWFRALLLVGLPVACATATQPDLPAGSGDAPGAAGTEAEGGGGSGGGGSAAIAGTFPVAGMATTAGKGSTAFGGTSSEAGKSGAGSGGSTAGSGGKGGSGSGGSSSGGTGAGGKGGSGGTSSGGSAGSGGAASTCTCTKTIPWVDNMSINSPAPPLTTGQCVTVAATGGTKTFLYVGTIPHAYLDGACNPTKQMDWCDDMGNDYKFMSCD